jgi:excisionase family DNA binding protein
MADVAKTSGRVVELPRRHWRRIPDWYVSVTVERRLPAPLLTLGETARLLGRDPRTVRRRVRAGRLAAVRIAGTLRFEASEVARAAAVNERYPSRPA